MSSSIIEYIGPYRLINAVYSGQNSRTWQAYDDRHKRFLGIKTLFYSSSRDSKQVRLLKWEYAVGSKLDHPRVIHMYEYGKHSKVPYIAMEWYAGTNIKQWINRGYEKYCVELTKMMTQMLEAIAYLHESGWVHRDVKPDNFLYSSEGGVKLIDFALARKDRINPVLQMTGFRIRQQGTPTYMSPEQILGKQLDHRADLYCLGCTFFEMLCERPMFTGVSVEDLLQKHVSSIPPSIIARNTNVTKEFSDLLKQMLAKRPNQRPKTARDILLSLRAIRIFRRAPALGDKVQ